MQSFTFLALLAGTAIAADVGAEGELSSLDAGLMGTVMVKDMDTLEISGYTLEAASAPALYWWGSETEDLSSGFRINKDQVTETADDETLTIALDNGYSADDFMYVGLWCEELDVNFGQAMLEGGDPGATGSGDDEATETDSADETMETDGDMDNAGGRVRVASAGAMVAAAAFAAYMV